MSTISGIAAAVRRLTARADALGRQCETLAGLAQDEATRATLARTSGRLNTSVVTSAEHLGGRRAGRSRESGAGRRGGPRRRLTRARARRHPPARAGRRTVAPGGNRGTAGPRLPGGRRRRRASAGTPSRTGRAARDAAADDPVSSRRPLLDHQRRRAHRLPRRAAGCDTAGSAVPLRRLGAQTVVRRLARADRLPRRQGRRPRRRPAGPISGHRHHRR